MNKQSYVFDSSALLALIGKEGGYELVVEHLQHAVMSSVNFAEVATVLIRRGHGRERMTEILNKVAPQIIQFSPEQAIEVGCLYARTKAHGLSLGDRACLAVAQELNLPVLSADKIWAQLEVGVRVRLIR